MPALESSKHDMACREFVRLWMAGDPTSRQRLRNAREGAYRRAGFQSNGSAISERANARRFFNREDVKRRIDEFLRECIEHSDIRPEVVAIRVDRIGRARVPDYYEEDGRTLKDLKTLPQYLQDAIKSIEWVPERHPDGTTITWVAKLELYDKLQANLALLRHLGPGRDDAPSVIPGVSILNVLSIDDQRLIAEALTEAQPALARGEGETVGGAASEPDAG